MIAKVNKMFLALTGYTKPANKGCGSTATDTDPVQSHGATTGTVNQAETHRQEEITIASIVCRGELENTNVGHHTALSRAAKQGHTEILQRPTAAGADIDGADNTGWTPLQLAATNGRMETVRILLAAAAHTETADSEGYTALDGAVRNGHAATTRVLLHGGAEVNALGYLVTHCGTDWNSSCSCRTVRM